VTCERYDHIEMHNVKLRIYKYISAPEIVCGRIASLPNPINKLCLENHARVIADTKVQDATGA
jgi:hypothetical protein